MVSEPQYLQLEKHPEDEKRWVAEIAGKDETFVLKRLFQPEIEPGVWQMYDGWYQVHGLFPNITPFHKEYVRVKDGKMTRRLEFRYVLANIDEIIAAEPERVQRLQKQIFDVLDKIVEEAPYEQVREEIEMQKEEVTMVESSDQLVSGLQTLLKKKPQIVKQYRDILEQRQSFEG